MYIQSMYGLHVIFFQGQPLHGDEQASGGQHPAEGEESAAQPAAAHQEQVQSLSG